MATKTPMNRALPLLLLIALAVAGLAFIALEPGRGPGRQTGTEATLVDGDPTTRAAPAGQVPDSSRATGLANVPERDGLELAGGSGPAKSWEIVPLNGVGQLVPNARITATSSSEERTAMGRIRWQGVPSGPWSVVIESDGNPTWRREVDLAPQSNRRTAARLGDEIHVKGRVIDTTGRPIVALPVFFLPPGAAHPERADLQRDTSRPRGPAAARNGAIAARPDGHGRFSARLPGANEWRVSVGPAGEPRWTQPKANELTHGGPDRATVTIPATATLRVEYVGERDARPDRISVYAYDIGLATEAIGSEAQGEAVTEPSITDEVGAKKRGASTVPTKAKTSVRDGQASGRGLEELFEPGWRVIASAPITAEGKVVLEDMPGGVDLRFLFSRREERIITASSYRLRDGRLSAATIDLPPLGTSPSSGVDTRASVRIALVPRAEYATLRVEFRGEKSARPLRVNAYAFDPRKASAAAERAAGSGPDGPRRPDGDRSEGDAESPAGGERDELIEPGWHIVESAGFDEEGVAELETLPGDEELRFLIVRGTQRIGAAETCRLNGGEAAVAALALPPLDSDRSDRNDAQASMAILTTSSATDEDEHVPGIDWGY